MTDEQKERWTIPPASAITIALFLAAQCVVGLIWGGGIQSRVAQLEADQMETDRAADQLARDVAAMNVAAGRTEERLDSLYEIARETNALVQSLYRQSNSGPRP